MHILCVLADPRAALADPESAAGILRDLGCRVTCVDLDLHDLDAATLEEAPPNLLCIDAGEVVAVGYAALRRLREVPFLAEVPALTVAPVARLGALDFDAGADDFVLRPIVPAELHARVRQLDWRTSSFVGEETLKVGDLCLDLPGYEARVRGRRLELTSKEFELLKFLSQQRGRVFTRGQLLSRVWGYSYASGTRTVDIHVRRLRAKLGAAASLLVTVRNVGYKVAAPTEARGQRDRKTAPPRRRRQR